MSVSSAKNSPATLPTFFTANRTWLHNMTFFSVILAMLGTPPTVGFFGKLLTFYVLSKEGGAPLMAVTVLTMFLLIFYLQAIRSKAYARKRFVYRVSPLDQLYATAILYGHLFLLGFAFFLPAAADILAAFFM